MLAKSASRAQKDEKRYKAYNKSSVVLLSAKFESFIENILEEYIDYYNERNVPVKDMPNYLKFSHTIPLIDKINRDKVHVTKHRNVIECLKQISELWDSNNISSMELNIPAKFSYGKHGEGEILSLFQSIGIDNIFNAIKITETIGGVSRDIDVKGKLNSIIGMRNNIIHTDASPALTHQDVNKFIYYFEQFALKLVSILESKLPSAHT